MKKYRYEFYNSIPESVYIGTEDSTRTNNEYIKDYGDDPFVTNIKKVTLENKNFRTALWTGKHLQITLMNIGVGETIGLEKHENVDQFIRIEHGYGLVEMGDEKNNLTFKRKVYDDFAFVIPAGTWHNLTNIGNVPIKLYSIYAPPNHPKGTIDVEKTFDNHHGD